jgi:YegS/Rv2252/BmrU family lipid kinase
VRVLLVSNRHSRSGRDAGAIAARELVARGIDVVPFHARHDWAVLPEFDAIVAAGGDGTLVRLIGRAMRANVPLGLIPGGTFNDLARTLDIPLDVAGACDVIAGGITRGVDVACVNGTYYLSEASIGISSRAARKQTETLKRRFGFAGIATTALEALWYARPMFAEVTYDDTVVTFKTVQLTIANSHRFGGIFSVADAAIDDGWLDLYSVEIETFGQAFRVARAILQGRRESVPGLRTLRARRFTVRQHRAHHITADGEPAGHTPATFEVLPKALRILVPD